jgi:hypothetical protein
MSSDRPDSAGTTRQKRARKAPMPESAELPRFVDVTEQKRLNDT